MEKKSSRSSFSKERKTKIKNSSKIKNRIKKNDKKVNIFGLFTQIEDTKKYKIMEKELKKEYELDEGKEEEREVKLSGYYEIFLHYLDNYRNIVELLEENLSDQKKKVWSDLNTYLQNIPEERKYKLDYWCQYFLTKKEFNLCTSNADKKRVITEAKVMIPNSLLIMLVSKYEIFLTDILRIVYIKFPKSLKTTYEISFEEISRYSDIKEIQEGIVREQVDSVMAKNSWEQLCQLYSIMWKKKEYVKNTECFLKLIETSLERNLVVHCDGKISEKHLKECLLNSIDFSGKSEGSIIKIDKKYLLEKCDLMFEVASTIFYDIYSILSFNESDKMENLYDILQDKIFDQLVLGNYKLAQTIWKFILNTLDRNKKAKISEPARLVLIVNYALSYKMAGENEVCYNILKLVDDRSTLDAKYRLAYFVLCENREESAFLMEETAEVVRDREKDSSRKIHEDSFQERPLFFQFRETSLFRNTYKKIFKRDFLEEN